MGESSERVDVLTESRQALRRELQAHGRHGDERTRDEQHHMERRRLQDHLLAAMSIDMDVGGEGNAPDVEVELGRFAGTIGRGHDDVARQAR